jgi:transposase
MLGVDVSKAELHGTWRDPETRRIGWQGVVPNTEAGIRQLLRRVPAGGTVVVEPTGRYGEPLVRAAVAAGRGVLLATPKRARAFLFAEQPRAKTDRLDSAGLALYGLGGRLRPYPLPSPAVDQVQQLLAARRGLSQSLMSLRQQRASLPLAAEALTPAIAGLERELAALDARLKEAAKAEELATAVTALKAVPGIGPVIAAALAACLVTKRFTHPDQVVAHVGLDIRVRQSGRRTGTLGLSKHGDAELRRLLYVAAMASTRCTKDRTFADRYARERAKGLTTTAALNAVARKLAKVAWSLVAHGATYDPKRVDTQPPPPTAAPAPIDAPAET